MGDPLRKKALFTQFAAVGKAVGHPARLELVDLLAQGPRSVDQLANEAGLAMSTCSAHLRTMHEAGLVENHRDGKRVIYSLAGDEVARLWDQLRVVSGHRPQTAHAARAYLGPEDTDSIGTEELFSRVERGSAVPLDVRPHAEFSAGHLPGAIHIPLSALAERLAEVPEEAEVVAYCRGRYCVLAHEATRLLTAHGYRAVRSAEGIVEWRAAGIALAT